MKKFDSLDNLWFRFIRLKSNQYLISFSRLCLLLLIAKSVCAQDFSNKGTEFWVGYGYHQAMVGSSNTQDMVLYFTSDVAATVKVEIPGVGWTKTYQVAANTVTESDPMPKSGSQDARLLSEGLYDAGIHITSDNPIVAYAHIYSSSNSGASLLFPVNTLWQEYYSLNFTQKANTYASNSWAFVIATEDNTMVEITPSGKTLTHAAGTAFTVALNKGQIYNVMGETNDIDNDYTGVDMTGTRIRSVSTGTQACKRIAVFSGSGRVSINCENAVTSSDILFQQVFPQSAWGKKFLTVPTANLPNNYFRIAVSDPATVVTVDGAPLSNLINNFYYEITAKTPKSIVADKPVTAAQYITSSNDDVTAPCGNSFNYNGDPEMIYLSPIEQTIDKVTLNSTSHYQITSHYINVVIKTSSVNSFTLDRVNSAGAFATHPADPAYSYAVFNVMPGAHSLQADSGFNAIAYGYGTKESYGYNAGTNIKNLNEFITVQNPFAVSNTTCSNTPFSLSVTLPYQPSSLVWDFGNNPNLSPSQNITDNNPVADSSYSSSGTVLYVYKLKTFFSLSAPGNFPVKIIANNQSSDGCAGQHEIDYTINVVSPPVANFTFTYTGYATDITRFLDASNGNGSPIVKWEWDFGNGATDTVKNPSQYYVAGIYNVRLRSINNIGCFADTLKVLTLTAVRLNKLPDVKITSPANNTVYFAPATIALNATATDADGTINSVKFYNGGTLLGSDSTSPYSYTLTNVAAGNYSFVAKATDTNGGRSSSASVAVVVTAPVNKAPVVKITSPANNTVYTAPATFTINATASDSDGTITRVRFYNGGTLLATDSTSPYSYTISNLSAGNYSFVAKAIDNNGLTSSSSSVAVAVSASSSKAPSVSITSPAPNAVYAAPASITINALASDPNAAGSIVSVKFYSGATLLTTDSTAPYTYTLTNAAAGTYSITAKATDNTGSFSSSASVTFNVIDAPNKAPVVSITSPANNATYNAPATITINAAATDADGSVRNVQFYSGSTLLKTDSTSPYSYTFSNLAAGTYSVTAKATDNLGLFSSSASAAIIVSAVTNKAPVVSITSPDSTLVYTAPATITINALASDEDGTISSVKFYNGTTYLKTVTASPYTYTLPNLAAGNYSFTAKATDNNGAETISAAVTISVKAPNKAPTVRITNPANNATYTAPATITINALAADADGAISSVKFYNGTTYLKTVSASPYTYTLSNLAAGTYTLTAKATDDFGAQTISAAVTVKVVNAAIVANKNYAENEKTALNDALSLRLSPNPAGNILNIYATGLQPNKPATLSIISVSGIALKIINISNAATQLDVSTLASGVYTLKIMSGDKVLRKQFVKL